MKKLTLILTLGIALTSFNAPNSKVLMYIEDNSNDLAFMLINEAGKMQQILEQSGFDVEIASITGEILKTDSVTVQPDLKLSDVDVNNYEGFIFPCMATEDSVVTMQERIFVQNIVKLNKPLAAQTGAVLILAKAGVLKGKKFAYIEKEYENMPDFKTGIFSGIGVIQDGNIITSGTCPMMSKMSGNPDGTSELTNLLVQVIKAEK